MGFQFPARFIGRTFSVILLKNFVELLNSDGNDRIRRIQASTRRADPMQGGAAFLFSKTLLVIITEVIYDKLDMLNLTRR